MDGMFLFLAIVFGLVAFKCVSDLLACLDARTARKLSRNITDEEFLAALPGVDPERALQIRGIISYQLDIPVSDIHPDDSLVDDLGAD